MLEFGCAWGFLYLSGELCAASCEAEEGRIASHPLGLLQQRINLAGRYVLF